MEFLILAHDGTDDDAPARRLAARPAHLERINEMIAAGTLLYAALLLDDTGQTTGSSLVCTFPSRADLDAWLALDPYVTGHVWQKIEVHPCKPAPAFTRKS